MADEVKIVVILDSKDAKKKLKAFDKGVESTQKTINKRVKKKKSASGGFKKGFKKAQGRAKAGIDKIQIILALLNKIVLSVAALTESSKKEGQVEKTAKELLALKVAFLSNVTGALSAVAVSKRFARAGIGGVDLADLQKTFTQQSKIQIETADKASVLGSADYGKALKQFGGFGGN